MQNLIEKILLISFCLMVTLVAFVKESQADVRFVVESERTSNARRNLSPASRSLPCPANGYALKSCTNRYVPSDFCPYDASYFKTCVCSRKYKFDSVNCPYPMLLSGDSCGGKYEACKCEAKYKYTKDNCPAPKTLSGKQCGGKFERCACSAEYYKTCTGGKVGVGESCGGKYKACKCASNYKTCGQGEPNASTCIEENGVFKYSQCKGLACENDGYLSKAPEGSVCKEFTHKGMTCYRECRTPSCADGGFYSRNPSEAISCPLVEYKGLTCYNCDVFCGYCSPFTGHCSKDCVNNCRMGMWFDKRLNGNFTCKIKE